MLAAAVGCDVRGIIAAECSYLRLLQKCLPAFEPDFGLPDLLLLLEGIIDALPHGTIDAPAVLELRHRISSLRSLALTRTLQRLDEQRRETAEDLRQLRGEFLFSPL